MPNESRSHVSHAAGDVPIDGDGMADLALMHRLADVAAAAIVPHFRTALDVASKLEEGYDPVTVADRAAEAAIREVLARERPDDGILGEELPPVEGRSGRTWILDPIDGTRAFVTGLLSWGTLIGLSEGGRRRLGMMAQPFVGERFFADGTAAYWRRGDEERRLRTRRCRDLSAAIVASTSPDLFTADERRRFEPLHAAVRHVRWGTDCYGYAMLAAGQIDLVVETGLKPYDIAPFLPLVPAAGGAIVRWDGGVADEGGQVVAVGDPGLLPAVLERLGA